MINSRYKMMNILSYVDSEKLCHVIKYFTQLNQKMGKKTLLFLSHQFEEPLNGEKYILMNFNKVCLKLIQDVNIPTILVA